MKIAYVCGDPGVPVFGRKGCSIHVQEVIRALRGRGVEVELFAVRLGGEAPADLEDVRVRLLPVGEARDLAGREAALRDANENGVWAERLAEAGECDAVYERHALWACAAMEHARALGIPGLLEVNAPLVEEQSAHRGLVDVAGARVAVRRAFGAASVLLAVSREVGAYLEDQHGARGRVEVVANGVDAGRFGGAVEQRRRRWARDPRPTIGFVGTLKPWHGTDLLVEAFRDVVGTGVDARLLIVGDGPERARLEAQVEAAGVSGRTIFTGAVAPEAVPGWLGAMDIAVAPYPGSGPFYFSPLKVYEYMAAGLPVVASRLGQLEGLIQGGRNGLLVEAGNTAELARALGGLAQDRALRERLGGVARLTVERGHSWDSVAARILERVEALAGQGAGVGLRVGSGMGEMGGVS